MPKFQPKITTLLLLTFLTTLGLAISLQGVLGINIGSNLDLGNAFKITKVVTPTDPADVATKGWVESIVGGPVSTGLYGHCIERFTPIGQACPYNVYGFSGLSAPAFCTSGTTCSCPAGYTRVIIGDEGIGPGDGYWFFSCRKD